MKNGADELPPLPETDVRKIVHLLGEVIAAPGDIHEKRRLLMDGVCGLVDATAWVWAMSEFHPDKPPSSVGLVRGGFDEERFACYLAAINHPAMELVMRPSSMELQVKGTHLTRTRLQMDPDFLLENSPAGAFWEKADIGPLMTSMRPMKDGGMSAIGIYRKWTGPTSSSARRGSPTSCSVRFRGFTSRPSRTGKARR